MTFGYYLSCILKSAYLINHTWFEVLLRSKKNSEKFISQINNLSGVELGTSSASEVTYVCVGIISTYISLFTYSENIIAPQL